MHLRTIHRTARPRYARLALAPAISFFVYISSGYIAMAQTAPEAGALYRNPQAPLEDRVEDLLSRMTLEEKVGQIVTVWDSKANVLDDELQFDLDKLRQAYPLGIGHFARPSDARGPTSPRVLPWRDIEGTIELVNAIQDYAVNETRLGIPVLFHEEGLHGYASVGATSFPQAIALASTWDPELVRDINSVIAREIRVRGVHLALSPVVDVARDARWGRIEETFGEDPYLVGEMGVAAVEGLQGAGKDRRLPAGKVYATLKHMTGHGQPESGTNIGPAQISERELRESFFPPFEQVVKRTAIAAVMPSYNEIDGVPSHANGWLLNDILRGEWGFDGVVVSDYYAIDQLAELHYLVPDRPSAAVLALNAGVDADLPDGGSYQYLPDLVKEGRVSMAQIDTAVRRLLELKFRAGLFEETPANLADALALTNNDEARALALTAAQRSIILLKNNGVLPLSLKTSGSRKKTIAVIGPNAAVARLGGYYGIPPVTVSILEGVKNLAGDSANIVYSEGVKITENDDWWADEVELADPAENRQRIADAVKVASGADVIVLAIGDTEQTSREAWADAHLGDRNSLDLVGEQQELFDAMKALGKPVVVILINGRPASTVAIAEQADALVEGWYLGEQGGNAMADVLFGRVNPGGKLPVTIPRNVGQLPMFYNHKPSARRGYLFDTVEPLFPFGWGLSYTTFEIGKPKLGRKTIAADGFVDVQVPIRNTGKVAGDETVQLYIRDKISSVTRPVVELRAFERVTLKPGERRSVVFRLGPGSFQMWNADMERLVEPGEFEILAGPNSVDLQGVTLTVEAAND